MSLDLSSAPLTATEEARRQIEICNAQPFAPKHVIEKRGPSGTGLAQYNALASEVAKAGDRPARVRR